MFPTTRRGRDLPRGTRPSTTLHPSYHKPAKPASIGIVALYALRRFKTSLLEHDCSETSRLVDAVDILLDYEEGRP
jgi:hypothetical protein